MSAHIWAAKMSQIAKYCESICCVGTSDHLYNLNIHVCEEVLSM